MSRFHPTLDGHALALEHPQAPQRARHHAQSLASRLIADLWRALVAAGERVARARRLSHMQATLAQLDDATLRDIGLRRSEAQSVWAEAEGLAPLTRQNVVARRPYAAAPTP